MMVEKLKCPRVIVLLATYNGSAFIAEQLESIAAQQAVRPEIVLSDDGSTDDTVAIATRICTARGLPLLVLPKRAPSGSAAANFFRLMRDTDFGTADFVALCDQDDIWLPGKLARAASQLSQTNSDAYSCNSIAFWAGGLERNIRKDYAPRRWDMLFESASHGCTYVLTTSTARAFAAALVSLGAKAENLDFHDWLIYAWCRTTGRRWHFDHAACIRYRQAGHNVIGANKGWQAAVVRIRMLRSGWLRRQALLLADCLDLTDWAVVRHLRRDRWTDRIVLAMHAQHCRRRPRDQIVFFLACVTFGI